jgi:hypothetical protein
MTIARAHLVDPAVSRWYHCVTRCVGRAFLLGDEHQDRKTWIESRLQELSGWVRPKLRSGTARVRVEASRSTTAITRTGDTSHVPLAAVPLSA